MERTFKLSLTFNVKIGNLEEKKADSNEKRMIKSFLRVFMDTPESVDNYYKAYLADAVADMNDNVDFVRDTLDVSIDERDYFSAAAEKCPVHVKTFINNLYAEIPPKDCHLETEDRELYKDMIQRLLGKPEIINVEFTTITN